MLTETTSLLAIVPVPLVIVRASDKTVLYTNPAFESLFRGEDAAHLTSGLHALYQKDGSRCHVIVTQQTTAYEAQDALILTLQDVTPLKNSEERASALTGFISDVTYTYGVDENKKLTREALSDSFSYITGFLPEEKDILNEIRSLAHADDVEIAAQQVQDVLAGYPDSRDFRIVTKSGDVRWVKNYLHPVKDENNRVVRLYGMTQDTTYYKRAEEAFLFGTQQDIAYRMQTEEKLRNYAAELESVNRELDAYSHTIAHDLKAPLSGILGFVELMEYFVGVDGEKAKKYAGRVRESAEYMTRMVGQLLTLAKLRNAQEAAEKVEILPLLDAMRIRFSSAIEKENVTIELAENLPPAMGHAPWIEEIFANFINNAIKYKGSDNTAPVIKIRGAVQDSEVRYEVEDNGIGIKPEDQAKLFEMFTRLHAVEQEGSGLGLSIVHRIVDKLNGKVGVQSEYGKGSTFWFTLPKAD